MSHNVENTHQYITFTINGEQYWHDTDKFPSIRVPDGKAICGETGQWAFIPDIRRSGEDSAMFIEDDKAMDLLCQGGVHNTPDFDNLLPETQKKVLNKLGKEL